MYISKTVIKLFCAAMWIGGITLGYYVYYKENEMSKDLQKVLTGIAFVMLIIGFIAGNAFGLFPSDE